MKAPGADPAARLVSTMIDVLVTELAEPGRLRRGRDYARQGAVGPLTVAEGMVSAVIQGSRSEPYVVTARVTVTPGAAERLSALVPGRRDIRFACSCPDDDAPCKHAVALMATFSERLAYDPSLFVRWRTGADALEAASGVATASGDRSAARARDERADALDDEAAAELRAFLGEHVELPPSGDVAPTLTLTELAPPRGSWDEVWVEMLASAIDEARRPTYRRR